jgi:hypothetical protein
MRAFDFFGCRVLFPAIAVIACISMLSTGDWEYAVSCVTSAFYAWIYFDAVHD